MKKPTRKLHLRQRRIARYRAIARAKRRGYHRSTKGQRYFAPGEVLIAPPKFDVTRGSGLEVAKFLRAFATTVLTNRIHPSSTSPPAFPPL